MRKICVMYEEYNWRVIGGLTVFKKFWKTEWKKKMTQFTPESKPISLHSGVGKWVMWKLSVDLRLEFVSLTHFSTTWTSNNATRK